MSGWLDTFIGAIFSNGVAVDEEGAINFTDGIEAVQNTGASRVDVKPSSALRTMATRVWDIRLRGIGSVTGGGTTTINNGDYTLIGGTFVGGSNDATIVASTTAARLTYTGTDNVRALVIASCTVSCTDSQDTAITIFADGAPLSDVAAAVQVTQLKSRFSACALTTLSHDDAIDIRAVGTDEASEDLVVSGLSLVVVLLGAV